MASAGGCAGPGAGLPEEVDVTEVDMEIVEPLGRKAERVGLKRVRDSPAAAKGFLGVTSAKKKSTLQPCNKVKFVKKADNANIVHQNVDDTSKMGGFCLHGTHGLETLLDSNPLSSSPGGDMENNTRTPTKICTFYAQGRCKKGKSCTFLHGEVSGSDNHSKDEKTGVLGSVGYENHRGSEEGSQAPCLSNMKELHSKNLVGSSKHEIYRTLIHAYGEDSSELTHAVDKLNSTMLNGSKERFGRTDDSWITKPTIPVTELGQIPTIQEKEDFMGRHVSLTSDSYFDVSGAFPRLQQDGGMLQPVVTAGNNIGDSHVSRSNVELSNPDFQYRTFDSSISLDKKLSAYGGTAENLLRKHQKAHSSSHVSYSSYSFRNPWHNSFDRSLGSPSLQASSYPGMQSFHQLTPGIEKVGIHRDLDFDKGCNASRPALLVSTSPHTLSFGHLSPIKDEVWVTSVPFVPSFPGSTSSNYDPLVDSIDNPKAEGKNNLKPSNISFSISSQHTDDNAAIGGNIEKLLNHDDKLARNMSAKGSNEFPGLIASDRGHSSFLDGDVKGCERKNDAAISNERTRDFRFHLAEHVKELVKPFWKEGNLSKDAHKVIVKKSVDKVLASFGPHEVPNSAELISNYIAASGTKIEKLVKAYVDKHCAR